MTTITARQPKGIPVGGHFAPTTHAEPAATPAARTLHERTHAQMLGDQLNSLDEAKAARAAIYNSVTAGDFDADAITVIDLAYGDRLVRLAVDRYVVTETQEPGAFRPKDTGHRLGQQLIDLHNEDLEDAANAREGEAL